MSTGLVVTGVAGDVGEAANAVRALMATHLGVTDADVDDVPIVVGRFERWRHVSLHAALSSFLADGMRLHGVALPFRSRVAPGLAEILVRPALRLGPVDHVALPDGPDSTRPCVSSGVITGTFDGQPMVAWMHLLREDDAEPPRTVGVDVACQSVEAAAAWLAALRERVVALDPYRGQSLRLDVDPAGNLRAIHFQPRPTVSRDHVILPDGVLDAIEEHAVGVGRHADRLLAAGQHVKRGLLLYGPPGTGKTHTVRYLTSRMPDATLFVLTGGDMGKISQVSRLLADLAPAVVILDDIDLIAEDRERAGNAGATLFNLLDAMDGVAEDVDVLFICTTNRFETIEGAIAARPGRIDQAVEIAVPDAACRERLLRLYSQGLGLEVTDPDVVVERTAGVTASFIKELMRRAALIALDRAGDGLEGPRPITVTDADLRAALDLLLDPAHPLTRSLLGVHDRPDPAKIDRQHVRGVGTAWCGV